jgi:RimJ/RimL family protein N-acetyltransferase
MKGEKMKLKYVEIVPFEAEHALSLDVREHEKPMQSEEAFVEWAKANSAYGPAFSGKLDGKIIGCGGVRILWSGVGEAWALFSKDITGCPKEAYYYIHKFLHKIIRDWRLHRVQAHVRTDVPVAVRYLENLGFEKEGLMSKFDTDKRDHFLYALVR